MKRGSIQTPMFKAINFKFDTSMVRDEEAGGSSYGEHDNCDKDSVDRQSAEQSKKSLLDISQGEEHRSRSQSFSHPTKEQEIQTDHTFDQSPKQGGFLRLKQLAILQTEKQDAETQMSLEDLKLYFPAFYYSPTNQEELKGKHKNN